MSQLVDEPRVVPAQLDFLAIYNPTLSGSDENLQEQIVYYFSRTRRERYRDVTQKDAASPSPDETHERLRQIGLAQGMVSFAKNFSHANVDTIETDKSRLVVHELETDWWILASISVTRLPASKTSSHGQLRTGTEYSAREVTPAPLLITQLVRANALFLLHHATTLSELWERVGRDTCSGVLERYWDKFVRNWDVLLHGNPATAIYNATKLGGGGELGIGVGEEEWGSGEREVLEGFIDRTDGLRDLLVGRYGRPPPVDRRPKADHTSSTDWLGTGNDPVAADGIIFSGKGLISRRSLRTISQWMEAIFKYGDDAYGVNENPSSRPRQRRQRQKIRPARSGERPSTGPEIHPRITSPRAKAPSLRKTAIENNATPPGIPAPLVGHVDRSLDPARAKAAEGPPWQQEKAREGASESSGFGTDNMMKYLTLGYGTSWARNRQATQNDKTSQSNARATQAQNGNAADETAAEEPGLQEVDPTPEVSEDEEPFRQKLEPPMGRFLIGLSGDLEQTELDSDGTDQPTESTGPQRAQRLFLRTLTIEMAKPKEQQRNPTIRSNSHESTKSAPNKTSAAASIDGARIYITHEKVQVAVYVHQPFIFVFLFELHTPNLTMPAFYRSIHNQLGPLQQPLLKSTDPAKIAERIAEGMGEKSSTSATATNHPGEPIYDLVYDPAKLVVRTSIPNIPIPGSLAAEGLTSSSSSSSSSLTISGSWYTLGIPIGPLSSSKATGSADKVVRSAWSRTEALNAHTQILNTYMATRSGREVEHTAKTARGWWVLWMKIMPSACEVNKQKNTSQEPGGPQIAAPSVSITSSLAGDQPTKEAFLVRKAADFTARPTPQAGNASSGPGRWLLREQKRDGGGASSAGGTLSAKGVSDGVGVDARKWIEGLLTLTQ